MPTLTKDARLPDVQLPEFELPKVDLSTVEMPKIDVKKVDVGKAVSDAAIAVGLTKPRRARWPYLLGAGLAVAAVGLVAMNATAIRQGIGRARAWASERVNQMWAADDYHEPTAFDAARTADVSEPSVDSVTGSTGADYPEGLGIETEAMKTNGRRVGAGTR